VANSYVIYIDIAFLFLSPLVQGKSRHAVEYKILCSNMDYRLAYSDT
jgi:hypothetical protein